MSGPVWTIRTVANGWIIERHDNERCMVIGESVDDDARVFHSVSRALGHLQEELTGSIEGRQGKWSAHTPERSK